MDLATIARDYRDRFKTVHGSHTTPDQWSALNAILGCRTDQYGELQQRKLLPVEYFMVTFTLPRQLRALAKANQRLVYALLFECAVATLKAFGLNDKGLAAELAMTAVLHTHSRRLDYHPHVHLVIHGGGVNTRRNEWRKLKGKYLSNELALAATFRGKLL